MLPGKPTGERCPKCGAPIIMIERKSKVIVKCSSSECSFSLDDAQEDAQEE
jgi:ssDNA-binding Zn-finger/Zn-ribbon topoisomerase 1